MPTKTITVKPQSYLFTNLNTFQINDLNHFISDNFNDAVTSISQLTLDNTGTGTVFSNFDFSEVKNLSNLKLESGYITDRTESPHGHGAGNLAYRWRLGHNYTSLTEFTQIGDGFLIESGTKYQDYTVRTHQLTNEMIDYLNNNIECLFDTSPNMFGIRYTCSYTSLARLSITMTFSYGDTKIFLGETPITSAYLGNTKLNGIYLGNTKLL